MRVDNRWRLLGWRHSLWGFVRFYRGLGVKQRQDWLRGLRQDSSMMTGDGKRFRLPEADVALLLDYLPACEKDTAQAFESFRTEAEGLAFCQKTGIAVTLTKTRMEEHHQSSKCLVAAVTAIAKEVCAKRNLTVNANPQARCVWFTERGLHVTARNLDGAIPAVTNPKVVWEIKEYWGKTKGGSKMSDALYECNLVGLELREFEEHAGLRVAHIVFLDGKEQWTVRRSDVVRFIDLHHQGLVDHLIVGREVELEWARILRAIVSTPYPVKASPGLLAAERPRRDRRRDS